MNSVHKHLIWIIAALAFAIPTDRANADSIDVSFTYTGSAGDYTLNFTVANNLTSHPETYVSLFGVDLSQFGADLSQDVKVSSAPNGFTTEYSDPSSGWNNYKFGYGGRDFDWVNNWNAIGTPLKTGTTLSGFLVHTNAQVVPTTVNWFAFAYSTSPFGNQNSPPNTVEPQPFYDSTVETTPGSSQFVITLGFEGEARGFSNPVPEPTSLTLAGLGVLGCMIYGRRRNNRN